METNRDTKKNDNLEKSLNDFLNDKPPKKKSVLVKNVLLMMEKK